MAKSLRAKVEEHLNCSICLEHFREPKVLPCLHTFCQQCIAKLDMTGKILICPECRATTKVPFPPDISFLPSNFFAKNLLATLAQTSDSGSTNEDAKNATRPRSTQEATGPTPKPPPTSGSKQTSTKDDAKKAVKPKSNQAATGAPPKPAKPLFPRGSFVGDHIFRYGYHTWSVQIDHSDCPGCDSAIFEIGVISHVDGCTVAFHGYIKPGCCEDFDLELDMIDEELSVEPSFLYEAVYFDVYSSRLSPYLKIDCKTCEIAVTEASFHWHFKKH